MYNFDEVIDRRGTSAIKHDKYAGRDLIPLWVADSEFRTPEPVIEALSNRVSHGLFGYTRDNESLNLSVKNWLKNEYNWEIETSWILWCSGVVPAFNQVVRGFTNTDDKVAVQTPNYPPMLKAPSLHNCHALLIPTKLVNNRWQLDDKALEFILQQPSCKVFLLCNPMNPCGSVLTEKELSRIIELCQQHDVQLCSDEIHCDLILEPGVQHIPAGKLDPNSITLMAASKTFNIAGLGCSFAIIPNSKIRKQFLDAGDGIVSHPNLLGYPATEAAFTHGKAWQTEELTYLKTNRDLIQERLSQHPEFKVVCSEATFLAWVDCTGLKVDNPFQWFIEAGLAPSPGADFGEPQFVRINFGCARSVLEQALTRIDDHLEKHRQSS